MNNRAIHLNWNSDETRREWLETVKEKWLVSRKKIDEPSAEEFLSAFTLYNPPRPVLWRDMGKSFCKVWAAHNKRDMVSPDDRNMVTKWADTKMRAQSSENLYEPGQAPAFSRTSMSGFWQKAYMSRKTNRMVGALVS